MIVKEIPFEELFEIHLRNGLTRPTAVRGSGVKMVNMGELFAHSRIKNILMDRVPLSESESQNYLLKSGDLLFARQSLVLSGAGKCSIFLNDSEAVTYEGHIIRARVDKKKANPLFYYYFFHSQLGRQTIEGIVEQVAAAGIRGSDLAKLKVPYPPLPTQHAIARILGSLDDKIELNRQMNETLEAMARAIFQSWFVDFDPVRAKAEGRQPAGMDAETAALFPSDMVEVDGREVPKGWRMLTLGDLCSLDKGVSYKGAFLSDEGTSMINLGCFTGEGNFSIDNLKFYTGEYRDRHVVKSGDIVIANTDITQKRVVLGSPAIVPPFDRFAHCIFTHHVYAVRFKKEFEKLNYFVYFTLLNPEFRERAIGFATGTTVLALPRDTVLEHSFILPDERTIQSFNGVIKPVFSMIYNNIQQSRTLAQIRDALLPKLMSGELTIRDMEDGEEGVIT